jgi:hypothetical protein
MAYAKKVRNLVRSDFLFGQTFPDLTSGSYISGSYIRILYFRILHPDLTFPDLTFPDLTSGSYISGSYIRILHPDLTFPDLTSGSYISGSYIRILHFRILLPLRRDGGFVKTFMESWLVSYGREEINGYFFVVCHLEEKKSAFLMNKFPWQCGHNILIKSAPAGILWSTNYHLCR